MAEMMTCVECYIKFEESNIENRVRDVKERTCGNPDSLHESSKSHDTLLVRDKVTFKLSSKTIDNFMPLKTRHDKIMV